MFGMGTGCFPLAIATGKTENLLKNRVRQVRGPTPHGVEQLEMGYKRKDPLRKMLYTEAK